MSAANWTSLVIAIVACLGALTAYLKAHTTKQALDTHIQTASGSPKHAEDT
jgi:hypothetical protein